MSIDVQVSVSHPGFAMAVATCFPSNGVTAVFGPSGCGKTTLLRAIAGLERNVAGRIVFKDDIWLENGYSVPTYQRGVGMVFQDPSLFSHLTVQENLYYGFKRNPQMLAAKRDELLELLGIEGLLKRNVAALSGGERQRVAIARALFASPRLLLLDEPLSALDAQRKREILPYLERLHATLSVPAIYVSHSVEEVARLADTLILMDKGSVTAAGSVYELLATPGMSLAVGDEAGVVIEARVGVYDAAYGLIRLDFQGMSIWVPGAPLPLGQCVRLRVLARDVSIALSNCMDSSILNRLPAEVLSISEGDRLGQVLVKLELQNVPMLARITRKSAEHLGLHVGQGVWAQLKSAALLQ